MQIGEEIIEQVYIPHIPFQLEWCRVEDLSGSPMLQQMLRESCNKAAMPPSQALRATNQPMDIKGN